MNSIFRLLQPTDFTQEVIAEVLGLGMRSGTWQDSDVDYYKDQFLKPKNINIVCQDESGLITGYVLARPHNEVVQDYLELDSMIKTSKSAMFYVDHVNVDEAVSGKSLGIRLILEMIREANRRGVSRFSTHCRVINGFSKVIQRKFREGVKVIRRIEQYTDCNNEPFDYMEIVVSL